MRSYKCENCGAAETDEEVKKEQVEVFGLIPFEIEEQKADDAKRIWDEAKAAGFEIDGEILKQQGERYWENFEYGKLKKYTGKGGNVVVPNVVTWIGNSVFSARKDLTGVTIPDSVALIGSSSFSGCRGLTSVTLSNSVTSIEASTFSECSSLTSIILPSSVTAIEKLAFYGCSSLTSITIPKSVTRIEADAFKNCPNLTIYAEAAKKPEGWVQKLFGKEKWNPDKRPVVWGYKGK